MELEFGKVSFEDIDSFNTLMDDLSERAFDSEKMWKLIEKNNQRDDTYLMVAKNKENGEIVGSVLGVLFDDYCGECAKVMIVENVVTLHTCRRQGIAAKMFEHMENWGRENGAHYIILCSAMHRLEAHKFYEKIGYSEVKGYKKYL